MAPWPLLRTGAFWLAGLLWLLALLSWGMMRTAAGHGLLAWTVNQASGGSIVITGLDGALPDHLRAAKLELRDSDGVWLRATDVSLNWRPLPYLWNHVVVRSLSVRRLEILRQPLPSNSTSTTPRIDIASLSLPDVALLTALAGQPVSLSAKGWLRYASRHDVAANLDVLRSRPNAVYRVHGAIADDVANGTVTIREAGDGLLGRLAGLPGLGAIDFRAVASGDRHDNKLSVSLAAGQLSATASGTLALADRTAEIAFAVRAPSVRLNPQLGWTSLSATGHLRGAFSAPELQANLRLQDLIAGGYQAVAITGTVTGEGGRIDGTAEADGLRFPGPPADLLAHSPVKVTFTANLSAPNRPVQFALHHALIQLDGTAHAGASRDLQAKLSIPSLTPLARFAGGPLAGSASARIRAVQQGQKIVTSLAGNILADGPTLPARLLGQATFTGHGTFSGGDITDASVDIHGDDLASHVAGSARQGQLDFYLSLAIKDMSRLLPALKGNLALSGRLRGAAARPELTASGTADLGTGNFAPQQLTLHLRAAGLPLPLSATLKVRGHFAQAPLRLDASLSGDRAGRAAAFDGQWKSLSLSGKLQLAAQVGGKADLAIKSLTDLSFITASPVKGAVHLSAELKPSVGGGKLFVSGRAQNVGYADMSAGSVALTGTVDHPLRAPITALTLDARQLRLQGWTGQVHAMVQGPWPNLAVGADAQLKDPAGAAAELGAKALLDASGHSVELEQAKAAWRGQNLDLAKPAIIHFAKGLRIEGLAIAAAGGRLMIDGRVTPDLDLSVSAQGIGAEALSVFWPALSASGTFSGSAKLGGTLAAPRGNISLEGRGLRERIYAVTAAATANLDASVSLRGALATVNATLTAGKNARLSLIGEVPFKSAGALNLRAAGTADLALLDPILGAAGQRVRGVLQINAVINGTMVAPRARGSAVLSNGEFQDYPRGILLRDIQASLKAGTGGIHIVSLSARAGSGTISGNGVIDIWQSAIPLDITLRADNARAIASDLLTANVSGSAGLSGNLNGKMTLKGAVTVPRAEINLPRSFPPEVRTLNVRHRGLPAPPAARGGRSLGLDVSIRTNGPVTLRGRGIDADLGGNLQIGGTAQDPRIGGALEMRRGSLTVAGQVLNFATGRVTFDGTGVRGRTDPALDFVASETSNGVTATLTVRGYASAPAISLSSSPQLPQDEVVARLLFQKSATQLSPLQLAEGAQALAGIAGIGSGFSPLGSLRSGLGLDRLSIRSGSGREGTAVEAGKFVSHNIYVGARQDVSGGTKAQVQVDLTKNLKAQATVSSGLPATTTQGATALQDNGSSVGLSYQFDY